MASLIRQYLVNELKNSKYQLMANAEEKSDNACFFKNYLVCEELAVSESEEGEAVHSGEHVTERAL